MRVLVANHWLVQPGGTETFTYTLIRELQRAGHDVEYFCFHPGEFSARLEQELRVRHSSRKSYDLILANHHTTVRALCRRGLIIQTCHGVFPELEQPSPLAHGHVSISSEVQDHLLQRGFASTLIPNGIDCERFRPLQPLRPQQPRVLSLCHSAPAHGLVREACAGLGWEFAALDKYQDRKWEVEQIINAADLVVGLGRSAYEALACGRPLVIYDHREYAGSLGDGYFLDCFPASLRCNCSGRALRLAFSPESLRAELAKYHPDHGQLARRYAVDYFDMRLHVPRYLAYADSLRTRSARQWRRTAARLFLPLLLRKRLYRKPPIN